MKVTNEVSSTNNILNSISEVFNFRFSLYQGICPSDSLTLPEKELMLFGMKISTFCHLTIVIALFQLIQQICCKRQPSQIEQPAVIGSSEDIPLKSLQAADEEGSSFPPFVWLHRSPSPYASSNLDNDNLNNLFKTNGPPSNLS